MKTVILKAYYGRMPYYFYPLSLCPSLAVFLTRSHYLPFRFPPHMNPFFTLITDSLSHAILPFLHPVAHILSFIPLNPLFSLSLYLSMPIKPNFHPSYPPSTMLVTILTTIPISLSTSNLILNYPADPLLIPHENMITMHGNGQPILNLLLSLSNAQPAAHFPFAHHPPLLLFLT